MRVLILAFVAALALPPTACVSAAAEDLPQQHWSFGGPFGTIDKAAAQRGFLIYQQVCSACHSMKQMYYRNLAGIGLNEAQIKAVAAAVTVQGALNDQGKPTERPGLPSDHFKPPTVVRCLQTNRCWNWRAKAGPIISTLCSRATPTRRRA
jgi:ubiquinol-cytochrome c reductase cytochrome c1 subunit